MLSTGERKVIRHGVNGGVFSVSYRCSVGHAGVWHSSSVLTEKRGQKVFVTWVLLSSAVLLTGKNFDKVELMAKMLRLALVSISTFNRIQTFHAVPAVKELWRKMKEQIWETSRQGSCIVWWCSNEFTWVLCQVLCIHINGPLLGYNNRFGGCRQTRGTSTVMEKMFLKQLMERIMRS